MRWMGLDVGERRIGVALSDSLELTAQGHTVINRVSLKKDFEELAKIVKENEVTGIVVGLPVNMNGSEGPMAEKVREFGKKLAGHTGITPAYWDERLSTSAAERLLIEADLSRKKRKGKIDQVAAVIILQNFLDNKYRIKNSGTGKILQE